MFILQLNLRIMQIDKLSYLVDASALALEKVLDLPMDAIKILSWQIPPILQDRYFEYIKYNIGT